MLYNLLLGASTGEQMPNGSIMRIVLWAIAALVLFRYWPPTEQKTDIAATPPPIPAV